MGVNRVYLTEAGARVAMYCQNNAEAISFTKFGLGSGENLSPKTATAMTNEAVRVPVQRVQEVKDGHYRVRAEMSNDLLTENLMFRELCLYCEDPKNMGVEVMYCYGNAKGADFDYTEEIPAFDVSGAYSSRIFEIDVFLQNDLDATFTIDQSGKADIRTVEELRADVDGKADIVMVEGLLGGMEARKFHSDNPDGFSSWLLFADVTDFYADNNEGKAKTGFTGYAVLSRGEGSLAGEAVTRLTACVSGQNVADGNTDETVSLKTDIPEIKPRVVRYNGKHYLAVENLGSEHDVIMMGTWTGCFDVGSEISLNNTGADTLPAGLEVVSAASFFDINGNAEAANTLNVANNVNGWTPDMDTVENWGKKKTCVWYFSEEGQLNGQPSNYGLLASFAYGLQIHQLWLEQGHGSIYHRGGYGSGGFDEWRLVYDSEGILPKANGGTGNDKGFASGLETAGYNNWTPETDTIQNWVSKGNCIWYFALAGQINNQPSNYGLLVNYVASNGIDVHQMWMEQGQGSVYHRSGNVNIGFTDWKEMIDSENIAEYVGTDEGEAKSLEQLFAETLEAWS